MADTAPNPPVADRATYMEKLMELRAREKAHTREGDAISAARRRLPMVEVDGTTPLAGAAGTTTLLDAFEGRRQLLAYMHMWFGGKPASDQCPGCSFFNGHVRELAYLHSRGVTYATLCGGPWEEISRYREFLDLEMPWYHIDKEAAEKIMHGGALVAYLRDGDKVFQTYATDGRGVEAMANSYVLLDMVIYGRQEFFEDSPEGWPQLHRNDGKQFWQNGRPMLQWSRLAAGRSDDLGVSSEANTD